MGDSQQVADGLVPPLTGPQCPAEFVAGVQCVWTEGHDGHHYSNVRQVAWPDHVSEGHDHVS